MKIKDMKFIDLFAGIGGFRQALEFYGAECVFSSEKDRYAIETYEANYGEKIIDSADSLSSTAISRIRQPIESLFNQIDEKVK